jgi:polyisoprenoid-binding protein YceI
MTYITNHWDRRLVKKQVPVMVVADQSKSTWTIKSVSSQREDSTGTKIAKLAFGGGGGFTKFEGTIQVIDNETSAVLYAYNVKKRQLSVRGRSLCQTLQG